MSFGNHHPGETLREELETRGLSAADLSDKLNVSAQLLHEIMSAQQAITPETALRLARYFGNEAEFWMNLQTQYDLAKLRRTQGDQIAAEVETAA